MANAKALAKKQSEKNNVSRFVNRYLSQYMRNLITIVTGYSDVIFLYIL